LTKDSKIVDLRGLIVFEDDDFLAINKPPYISSLDERSARPTGSILRQLKEIDKDIQLCHRLDKETSGVLLAAKNPEAYRHAAMAFEHRQVTKVYHAVVDGIQDFKGIQVYMPILPLANGIVKLDKVNGKEAETLFNTIEVFKFHTLMECMPITGRMHQIRIHLSYAKAPIVGDETYGGKNIFLSDFKRRVNLKKDEEELPLISRVALHAFSLNIPLMNGERHTIDAPYPKDMRALINQLQKHK
jgi:23S rRNA pseudouridine955/2504/2580 synthase